MKKLTGIAAIIALGISLTWAAGQVSGWLPFLQQTPPEAQGQSRAEQPSAGNEGILPSTGPAPTAQADSPPGASVPPDLSAEVSSIEEDLARIEEALQNPEVLEEFTPSEPLSADNPITMPTDI